jgi:hypothetical protein
MGKRAESELREARELALAVAVQLGGQVADQGRRIDAFAGQLDRLERNVLARLDELPVRFDKAAVCSLAELLSYAHRQLGALSGGDEELVAFAAEAITAGAEAHANGARDLRAEAIEHEETDRAHED